MKKVLAFIIAAAMLCTVFCACVQNEQEKRAEEFKKNVTDVLESVAAGEYVSAFDMLTDGAYSASFMSATSFAFTLQTDGISMDGMSLLDKMSISLNGKTDGTKAQAGFAMDIAGEKVELNAYSDGNNAVISFGDVVKSLQLSQTEAQADSAKGIKCLAGALAAAVKTIPTECIKITDTGFELELSAEVLKTAAEAFVAEGDKNGLCDVFEDLSDGKSWSDFKSELDDRDDTGEDKLVVKFESTDIGYSFSMEAGENKCALTPKVSEKDANTVEYTFTMKDEDDEEETNEVIATVTKINTSTSSGSEYKLFDDGELLLTYTDIQYNGDSANGNKHVRNIVIDGLAINTWVYTNEDKANVVNVQLNADGSEINLTGTEKDGSFEGVLSVPNLLKVNVTSKTVSSDNGSKTDITLTPDIEGVTGSINICLETDNSKTQNIDIPAADGTMTEEEFYEALTEAFGGIFGFGGDTDDDLGGFGDIAGLV